MRRSHEQRARAAALLLGATVRAGGDPFEVCVEAPRGKWFAVDHVHELVSSTWGDEKPESVWRDMADRLETESVEPCGQTGCEWCASSE